MPTHCTRPCCGKELDLSSPSSSSSSSSSSSALTTDPCTHHPGSPIFHEGQKSWSCCKDVNKPVLEFDEFVKIVGCTTVKGHSIEKPKKKEESKREEGVGAESVSGSGLQSIQVEGGKEVFGSAPAAKVAATKPSVPTPSAPPVEYVEPQDPPDAVIERGATCKRPGCSATFEPSTTATSSSSSSSHKRDQSSEVCSYHKGAPLFHEGSKGYTCCKRRVLEFDEFLRIEPCTRAKSGHLFTQPPKRKPAAAASVSNGVSNGASDGSSARGGDDALKSRGLTLEEGEDEADCKMDHYETPDEIRMTVYCKGVDMARSKILVEDDDILLSLALPPLPAISPNPRRHLLHLPLYAPILPSQSSHIVSPSRIKIDFTLRKKEAGVSWPTIVKGGRYDGYGLTFGRK